MRRIRRLSLAGLALLALLAVIAAIVYAGSPGTIAKGVKVDGIDVGGLSASQATETLQRRSRGEPQRSPSSSSPTGTPSGSRRRDLGLTPDWAAAVAAAKSQGDGFGPLRGFRRMKIRLFGGDVSAHATYRAAALKRELARMAVKVNAPHKEAAVVLHGLHPAVVEAKAGRVLDRKAAGAAIVAALSSLTRGAPVELPMKVDRAAGHRARAGVRHRAGADGGLGSGGAGRAEALPDPALADRHPAQAAEERRDDAADRRARGGRVLQGQAEAGRHPVA